MRKSDWVITLIGLVVIAFVAYFLYKKDVARRHLYEMYQHQRAMIKQIEPLEGALRSGQKLVEEKKYAEAKASLEKTQEEARKRIENLDKELGECLSDEEKGYFQPLKAQVDKVEEEADRLLNSDEVRFGAEGLALFEGKWLKPSRVKEIQETRFADEQRAKGLVLLDDKWVTPEDRDKLKERKFTEEQVAKGLVLYKGEWVTPEKRTELAAEARKLAQQAAGGAGGIKPLVQAAVAALTPGAFTPDKSVWMIDDFENGIGGWQVEQWSDPSQVSVGTLAGSKALSIEYAGGQQQKTALAHFMRPLDVSTRTKILMDVQNNGKRSVKLSIMLDADQAYETRDRMVATGAHKDIAFEIKGAVFKCQSDGWQAYKFPLGKPEAVRRIMLMVNTAGQIIIDNIRMVSQ